MAPAPPSVEVLAPSVVEVVVVVVAAGSDSPEMALKGLGMGGMLMCGGLILPFLRAYQTMMPMRQPKLRMKKSWMNLSVAMRRPKACHVVMAKGLGRDT